MVQWPNHHFPRLSIYLGGIIFLICLGTFYWLVDPQLYALRDDGLITLSHARHLVEFGFIGVSPSGERIEAHSTPLQFLITSLVYAMTGASYGDYAIWQTLICSWLLGVLLTLHMPPEGYARLYMPALAGIMLALATSFVSWHGSGMENAITHALLAMTVFMLHDFARSSRIRFSLAVVPFLASIARVDSLYHVLPLLLIFAGYWRHQSGDWRGLRFMMLTLLLWAAFNGWRLAYFGELLPNTAMAQGISLTNNLSRTLHLEPEYLAQRAAVAGHILRHHLGYLLILALPIALLRRRSSGQSLLLLLCLSIVITCMLSPFIFGIARLDPTRTTTQMAYFVVLATFTTFLTQENSRIALLIRITPVLLFVVTLRPGYVPPYYLCCDIAGFATVHQEFASQTRTEQLPRPTVSSPDLGALSWQKQFNIVDLGRLGSQMMAASHGRALADYFFDYAAPDLIESHESWSCQYDELLFHDPRFKARYQPVKESKVYWAGCPGRRLTQGIWIRRDILRSASGHERRLIDALARDLDTELVARELTACQTRRQDVRDCLYIARTVYRFLPEFRQAGHQHALEQLFQRSSSAPADLFLITGARDGRAYRRMLAFIEERQRLTGN